jgi:hypothetical protein
MDELNLELEKKHYCGFCTEYILLLIATADGLALAR